MRHARVLAAPRVPIAVISRGPAKSPRRRQHARSHPRVTIATFAVAGWRHPRLARISLDPARRLAEHERVARAILDVGKPRLAAVIENSAPHVGIQRIDALWVDD